MVESPFGWRELKLVLVVVLGTLLIGGGMLLTVRLNEAIDERVRVGAETTGRVVHVERFKISRSFAAMRLTVDTRSRACGTGSGSPANSTRVGSV